MGVLAGAPSYRQQQSRLVDREGAIDLEPIGMTTDPDKGRRQIVLTAAEARRLCEWAQAVYRGVRDEGLTYHWISNDQLLWERLKAMTTDPDAARRQIEAMAPSALQVGDLVRLKAGGNRVFTVVAIEDYGNNAVCEWQEHEGALAQARRDTFPAHTLVRISDEREQVAEGPQDTGQRAQEGVAQ
jgi:uncharacterized protein YodC (DUF2158 family)